MGVGLSMEVPSQHSAASPSHGHVVTIPSQQHWVHWVVGLKLWLCVRSPLGLGWAGTTLVVVWVWREQDGSTFVFTDIDIII